MGRPRKPSAKQKLEGTYRPDRRKGEPVPDPAIPPRPEWLGEAGRAEWDRVVDELHKIGVLTRLDSMALGLYCQAVDDYLRCKTQVDAEGFTVFTDKGNVIQHPAVGAMNQSWQRILKSAVQLGLTPASRSRVEVNSGDKTDEFGDFLGEKAKK